MATTQQFHLSRKDVSAVTPNKSMSYYSQNIQGELFFNASGHSWLKSLQC